jgi:hypothetical protein
VNVYGLEFSDLDIDRTFEGPTPVLVVRGAVRNIGADQKSAPPLRLALRDSKGEEIYSWLVQIDEFEIKPGGAAPFTVVLDNPPSQAADLEVTFATPSETAARPPVPAAAVRPPMPPAQPPIVAPEEHSDEPLALGPNQAQRAELEAEPDLRPATASDDGVVRAGPIRRTTPELGPPTIRG